MIIKLIDCESPDLLGAAFDIAGQITERGVEEMQVGKKHKLSAFIRIEGVKYDMQAWRSNHNTLVVQKVAEEVDNTVYQLEEQPKDDVVDAEIVEKDEAPE